MKKILLVALMLIPQLTLAEPPEGYCQVIVCNKIERFSLDPFSHLKDKWGETCVSTLIGQEDAVVGKELSSESRWYQGESINPTKKSVTRVKEVLQCNLVDAQV